MSSAVHRIPIEAAADVLAGFRKKGVDIWSENGCLRFRAPKNTLTLREIECLKAAKAQILALLEYAKGTELTEPKPDSRPAGELVPLTYQQQAHWKSYRLHEQRSLCQAVSALHLRGVLDISAIRGAIQTVVQRHEPLRTRIFVAEGGHPFQQIASLDDYPVPIEDLPAGPAETLNSTIQCIIHNEVTRGIDVSSEPLFWARIYRRASDEHILIISLEHLISDAASLGILLREIFSIYQQVSRAEAVTLPPLAMQLADYARWQVRTQPARLLEHGSYWNERLMPSYRVRFPDDSHRLHSDHSGWGWIAFTMQSDLKLSLQKFCRLTGTTLPIAVFTVYALLAMHWCRVGQAVFRYQSDGRIADSLQYTLGYLSAPLYMHVQVVESDTFIDLVSRASRQYCDAYEHADFSFLETRTPRPEFTRNAGFNWIPMSPYLDPRQLTAAGGDLTVSRIHYEHPMLKTLERDTEPFMELADGIDEVTGAIYFPLNRFLAATLDAFAAQFLVLTEVVVSQPHRRLNDISMWSNCP
jgi:hypothetical protein